MATLRGLIRAGNDIARLGFDRPGETIELVDRAEQIVFDLSQQRVSTRVRAHRRAAQGLVRDDHEAVRGGQRHHRHAVRLPRPRPPHVGVPARATWSSSRRDRRWASRRSRSCMAANVAVRHGIPVGAVHARDVEGRGDAAPDVRRGEGRVAAAPHRQARDGRLAAARPPRATSSRRRRSTSTTPARSR